MFVRIEWFRKTETVECISYRMQPPDNSDEAASGNELCLTCITKDGERHYTVRKDSDAVYVMNDSGKTIDRYVWSE